jgi:hypothetical protein
VGRRVLVTTEKCVTKAKHGTHNDSGRFNIKKEKKKKKKRKQRKKKLALENN